MDVTVRIVDEGGYLALSYRVALWARDRGVSDDEIAALLEIERAAVEPLVRIGRLKQERLRSEHVRWMGPGDRVP